MPSLRFPLFPYSAVFFLIGERSSIFLFILAVPLPKSEARSRPLGTGSGPTIHLVPVLKSEARTGCLAAAVQIHKALCFVFPSASGQHSASAQAQARSLVALVAMSQCAIASSGAQLSFGIRLLEPLLSP